MSDNYAFIDSQNVNIAIREQGWVLDFKKFRVYLNDKYKVKKAYLFIGYISDNQSLYNSLKNYGFELIFKPTLVLRDGKVKGNCDAELVMHALIEINNYNQALIVGGDGDYFCLVKYLKEKNKLLKLLIPDQYAYSSLYRNYTSDIHFMNSLKGKLEYIKKGGH